MMRFAFIISTRLRHRAQLWDPLPAALTTELQGGSADPCIAVTACMGDFGSFLCLTHLIFVFSVAV